MKAVSIFKIDSVKPALIQGHDSVFHKDYESANSVNITDSSMCTTLQIPRLYLDYLSQDVMERNIKWRF